METTQKFTEVVIGGVTQDLGGECTLEEAKTLVKASGLIKDFTNLKTVTNGTTISFENDYGTNGL